MNKISVIKDAMTSKVGRQVLLSKKHSPKILFVAGTVGVVGTVVLACRATLKVSDVLDQHDRHKDHLSEEAGTEQISHEDAHKLLRQLQINTAIKIAKPYVPALALGVVSIAALTSSHVILTKRNGALMAAYAALDRGFKEYRQRVADEFGTDTDRMFSSGASEHLVEEKLADGSTKTHTKTMVDGRFGGSPYAIVFDEQSNKFSKEPGRNASTVQMIQSYANDKLKAQGHLFLNEVKDMLGMPRTKEGAVVGWVYEPKNPDHAGDNYVDFGIFTGDANDVEDFIDGKLYYITLDFNVDGVVWDKI